MSSIKSLVMADITAAMKAREQDKLEALRLISSAIKQIEVDERIDLAEHNDRVVAILRKMTKQRDDSIEQFTKANRLDLTQKEIMQKEIIACYLPQSLPEAKIKEIITLAISELQSQGIDTSSGPNLGKVINLVKTKINGQAEMSMVSSLVKSAIQ